MNNRLAELGVAAPAMEDNDVSKLEEGKTNASGNMEEFFGVVESIKEDINVIRDATKQIGVINEESILAHTQDDERALSARLQPLISSTNKRAKRVKASLDGIKKQIAAEKQSKASASDLRVKENLNNTLTRKFVDEMKAYQNAQQKYKGDIKKKVKRQVQIVKPNATDDEIDAVMKSEGGQEALYKDKILTGVADPVKTAYAKVAGKYQDVLALESSITELYQMFQDFALLTDQQGELLNNIEKQVTEAAAYVEQGNVDIVQSIEYQKKIRKKQCWIIVLVLVAVIILLFALRILP